MVDILRSVKLSTRILLLVLALFVASIWGLAARVAAVLQTDFERLLSQQLSATLTYIAADLDSKIQLRLDTLADLAAAITPDIQADPAKLQALLDRRKVSLALFPTGVFVANAQGSNIAEYPRVAGRLGGYVGDRPYFRDIMAGRKQVTSMPVVGRFSKQPVVSLAVPLHDASGAPAGALIAAAYPSDPNLFGQLEQANIGKGGLLLVASPRDRVWISSNDKSRILQPLPARGLNPVFDRRMDEGFEDPAITTASFGVQVLGLSRNMRSTGWVAIAAVPTAEAFAPIASIKRQIYLTALALSLLALAVLYFVLRRQLAPLLQATTVMRRMTDGTSAFAPLPSAGGDEIGLLVQSFNQLVAERNRLEGALQRRELHTRALIDAMPIAVAHADAAQCITFANRVYRSIYTGGADPVGRSIREVVGEEVYAAIGPLIQRTLAGEDIQFDRPYTDRDGRERVRWVRYTPDRDTAGQVIGFFALIEDVSERKQAEAALAAKTALMRDTFDNMVEGISVYDRDWRLAGWNRRFAELLALPESLLHENPTFAEITRFIALRGEYGSGDPETYVRQRIELVSALEPHLIERTRPDGTVLEIRGTPLPGGGFVSTFNDITERKRALAALQASEAWFRSVLENANTGIASTDSRGTVTSFNEAFRAMLGYDAAALRRMNFADFTHHDDLNLELAYFNEILAHKREHYRITKRYIASDGHILWVDISVAVIRDAQGEVANFVGVVHDITERKHAEAARRESEERLRLVVESLAEGVVVQDAHGRIISANQAAQQILGLSEDQLSGRTSIDPRWRAVREDGSDFPGDQHPAMQTLRTGKPQNGVVMGVHKPDGSLSWLSINSRLLPGTDALDTRCAVTSFADVTAERVAAARQRLAASVFDHAAEAIMITDRNNNIISVNRAFGEITGYAEDEVMGKNPRLLSSGLQDSAYYQDMWKAIMDEGRWSGEIWDRRKNGEAYCEQLSISTVRDENGKIVNYCSMFTDITARKNVEAALQRLNTELEQRVTQRTQALEQANREMQSFSYSISHDLRAPLRAINGFSKIVLAANAGKFDLETVDNLGRIAAAAERMGRLIDDLLSLTQISRKELRRQTVNLSQLARDVAKGLAQTQPQRQVEFAIAPDMNVNGDQGLIQIMLENLIGNAWKFTAHTAVAKIEVGQLERDGELVSYVRDNGAGFDMRYAGKLFGAFQRLHTPREFEGSGIGLSIVQRIVIKHGGRIWAEAKPGEGAQFYFTLAPAAAPA